jgi:hypothetical protein
MSTTRLLAGSRRGDSLDGALEEVTEFECFDEVPNENRLLTVHSGNWGHIRIPDHTPVLDANLFEGVVDLLKFLYSLV